MSGEPCEVNSPSGARQGEPAGAAAQNRIKPSATIVASPVRNPRRSCALRALRFWSPLPSPSSGSPRSDGSSTRSGGNNVDGTIMTEEADMTYQLQGGLTLRAGAFIFEAAGVKPC